MPRINAQASVDPQSSARPTRRRSSAKVAPFTGPVTVSNPFHDFYRCPSQFAEFGVSRNLPADAGYFLFREAICYGRGPEAPAQSANACLLDLSSDVEVGHGCIRLPFDLSEVVTNLREERYHRNSQTTLNKLTASAASRTLYYMLRPMLGVGVRKHLQRIHLNGWDRIAFPRWPVDCTVESLMRSAMALALRSSDEQCIPFIWFWPNAASAASIVTHDVEGPEGFAFCPQLMDLDDAFCIKSSFQVVPELRYPDSTRLLKTLRSRGFEVNVHDLNHDGHLFHSRAQFLDRAAQINRYAREFDSGGFRAGGMYREQAWFSALNVSFDMSVPNAAHLEPQRGGCCTVMPYFVGKILELPLTTTQDYSLFHILNQYSTDLWQKQIDVILAEHGLITILTHPDYLIEPRAQRVYKDLLRHLCRLRVDQNLWIAQPAEVARWWRQRNEMTLVRQGDSWRINGDQSHRARVAYATLQNDRVIYTI